MSREEAAQQRGKKLLQAVAGIRPGSEATASWGVIRHQKVRVFAGLYSMKEMPAPEHRRGDDSDVTGTNVRARVTGRPPTDSRPNHEDMDCLDNLCERGAAPGGPRRIATTRCRSAFHADGGDISANKEAINASGALNRPRRSSGGTTASTASSFSEGSMRR